MSLAFVLLLTYSSIHSAYFLGSEITFLLNPEKIDADVSNIHLYSANCVNTSAINLNPVSKDHK
jgi:hypothetical protein